MLKEKIKVHTEALKKLLPERNEAIVQEAVLGRINYAELGRKYGLTKQRVRQILDKYHVSFTSRTGTPKHQKALERQSQSMMGVNKKVEKEFDLEDIIGQI